MNQQDNPLAELYERLNRGHDDMRESVLERLPSIADKEQNPGVRKPEHRQARLWNGWFAGSALGLAAALLLAASVWFVVLGSPSLTLAQVKTAVVQQKWILVEYGDGEESWTCLLDGRRFFKTSTGRLGMQAPGVSETYHPPNPNDGAFPTGRIAVHRATPEQMKRVPSWRPISAWDYLIGKAEGAVENTDSESLFRNERHDEVVGGRKLVRFDSIYVDALGNKRILSQLWADPVTRLPVRSRKAVRPSESEANEESFVDGVISFPETGPSDIYGLGAPRDAKIVRVYGPESDPEVLDRPEDLQQFMVDARAAVANFPDQFRLVKWHATAEHYSGGEIDVLYWNGRPTPPADPDSAAPDWTGVKIRQARYFNLGEKYPFQHLPLPADSSQVLDWTSGQTPVHLSIADGERTFSQTGPYPPAFEPKTPTVQVIRIHGNGVLFDHNCWPTAMYWPYLPAIGSRYAGHHELVEEPSDPIPNTGLLRITRGDRRLDYYVAPDRDYLCLKHIWWQQRGGQWHKDREYELSDLRQLPDKRWWAANQRLETFDNPDRGTSGNVTTYLIDIVPLHEDEFSPALFDGEKLLDDARKLDATIIAQ